MPSWKHRRRLIYGTSILAAFMIVVAALGWTDRQVSSQLVVGGVSLMTLILSGYVFAATFDDKWQRSDHAESDY